jgi:hypothetical protein
VVTFGLVVTPLLLAEFDATSIVERLGQAGFYQENVIFLNRQFGFDIDDMLAAQNSYGVGGTSYGLFDNDMDMALNLGFKGFLVVTTSTRLTGNT